MESLRNFIDQFRAFLLGDGNVLKLEEGLAPALYIIIFGVLGVILAFIIAIIVKNTGRASKFKKQLDDATAYTEATGTVDEENVFGLNQRIQAMPESVSKGWGNFLEQQTGYPSDYIAKNEVLGESKNNPNYSSGWGVFNFLSILTILLCWGISALGSAHMLFDYPAHLEKTAVILGYILPVFGALIVPLIAYLIFYFIFVHRQKRTFKKLETSFSAFQDALDNNVIIFREANDEFIEENIEEINAAIEDILANKLGQNDILEIVTTPEIDESLIIEDEQDIPLVDEEPWTDEDPFLDEEWKGEEVDEEPVEEVVEEPVEEVFEEAKETEEERERRLGERLVQLVFLADQASKDPDITKEEMTELREFLALTKDSGDYPSDAEQEIFESCLIILDGAYAVRFASEPEEIVEEPIEEVIEAPQEAEEPVVEEPVVEEPVVEEPQETEEERIARERGERLVQLVFLADAASKDKEITEEQFIELRNFLAAAKDSSDYPSDDEQQIFASCLQILDSAFRAKFGKPSPFAKVEPVKQVVAPQEVAEETIEESTEEAVEETKEDADEITEAITEEVAEESVEESTEEITEESVEESTEEVEFVDAESAGEDNLEDSVEEEIETVEQLQEEATDELKEDSEGVTEETEELVAEEDVTDTEKTQGSSEETQEESDESTEEAEEPKKKRGFFGRRKK